MYDDPIQQYFETDIYMLNTTISSFTRWLGYSLKRIEPQVGLLISHWEIEPQYGVYKPAQLIIARLDHDKDGSVLDLVCEITLMPIEEETTLVELYAVPIKKRSLVYQLIIHRMEQSWPQARKDRANGPIPMVNRSSERWSPTAGPPVLPPNYDEIHKEYKKVQESLELVREINRNVGGHPSLTANDWAFQELSKRPGAWTEIREQWKPKYLREVGEEVARIRDLNQAFSSAMRYRRKKAEASKRDLLKMQHDKDSDVSA